MHKTLLFWSLSTKKKLVGKTFEKIEAVFASIQQQQASKQKVVQKKTNWEIRTSVDDLLSNLQFFAQKIAIYIILRAKRARACISGEKISKSVLDTIFWIFPPFFSTVRPAILPAGPQLLDCQYWKKCGKIQNVASSSDFDIFFPEIHPLGLL